MDGRTFCSYHFDSDFGCDVQLLSFAVQYHYVRVLHPRETRRMSAGAILLYKWYLIKFDMFQSS